MKKANKMLFCFMAIVVVVIIAGCGSQSEPEAEAPEQSRYPDPFKHRFAGYEHECAPGSGILGYLDEDHYGYGLTPEEKRGACTWYLWAGGDPSGYSHEGMEKHAEEAKAAWVKLVMQDDFLERNFLSDDRRYPLFFDDSSLAIGTKGARAVATNATQGHVWDDFSSKNYKDLPSVGKVALYNPFEPGHPIEYEFPAGGSGYYRTPSLISIWATAPFLHNNELGLYNHDPSVAGRVEAFMDAAETLLWPDKRRGPDSIKVMPRDTYLKFRSLRVKVPVGTPIKLLANINLQAAFSKENRLNDLKEVLRDPRRLVRLVKALKGQEGFDDELKRLVPKLLAHNQIPDFIEDKGHTTNICRDFSDENISSCLSDQEKWALIEYSKFL